MTTADHPSATCSACVRPNTVAARFCRHCGAALAGRHVAVAETEGVSLRWILRAAAAMTVALGVIAVAGVALPLADAAAEGGRWDLGLGAALAFVVVGYGVGRRSPGRTVLEAGLGAWLTTFGAVAVAEPELLASAPMLGLAPLLLAALGAAAGERHQARRP